MRPVEAVSYRHMVEKQIRAAIASGELAPGERISEVAIAKRLGVSATPVREAFRHLERDGLIEVAPYRGARVRNLSERDLAESYSLRAHLENMAIRLAFPRLVEDDYAQLAEHIRSMEECAHADDLVGVVEHDVAFHRHILRAADHDLLAQTWEQINPQRWTYVTVRVLSERGPLYIAQRHWPLLEALRGPSLEAAVSAASDHIELVGSEALKQILRDPGSAPADP
jgi:DNA-binding GntR family transcriptional regulator